MSTTSTAAAKTGATSTLDTVVWSVDDDGFAQHRATLVHIHRRGARIDVGTESVIALTSGDQAHIVAFGTECLTAAVEVEQASPSEGWIEVNFLAPAELHATWLGAWMDRGELEATVHALVATAPEVVEHAAAVITRSTARPAPARETPRMSDNRASGRSTPPAKVILAGVLALVLVMFWAANRNQVKISFLLFDATVRVWVALLASSVVGAAVGYLLGRRN